MSDRSEADKQDAKRALALWKRDPGERVALTRGQLLHVLDEIAGEEIDREVRMRVEMARAAMAGTFTERIRNVEARVDRLEAR